VSNAAGAESENLGTDAGRGDSRIGGLARAKPEMKRASAPREKGFLVAFDMMWSPGVRGVERQDLEQRRFD
jgi:hypothetical protein